MIVGLFSWLFGKPAAKAKRYPRRQKPTEKQLRYARRIGLAVPPNATLWQVSKLLDDAEKANPKLKQQRELAIEQKRIEQFGPELIAQEKQLNQLGDQQKWLAAVYKSGKSIKVDVLKISGASINDKGKLKIDVEAGKVVTDRYTGPLVDTGRCFELDAANLLWSQVVDDFDVAEFERFAQTFEHAEKMAKKYGG